MPSSTTAVVTDPYIANDVATNKKSDSAALMSNLANMQAQANEDTRYDAAPPREGFKDASSDKLAIFAVLAIATFIIISRS
jgi:hypothetical protein